MSPDSAAKPLTFVLDNSLTMAWCFENEKTPYTEGALDAMSAGAEARVPTIWIYEVLNVLVLAQRRKRITQAQALGFWHELRDFSIRIEEKETLHSALEILSLADQHHLTAYDASYLELALRAGLPLATLDDDLKKAAEAAGVPIAMFDPPHPA